MTADVLPEADLPSEVSVLAGCIRYGTDAYLDAADVLRTESFVLAENQAVFACLRHALGGAERVASLDRPSLYAAASSVGLSHYFQQAEVKAHLESLWRIPVELESVRRLALRIRKLDVARELRLRHQQAMDALSQVRGDESIDDILRVSDQATSSVIEELSSAVRYGGARQFAEGARERMRELCRSQRPQIGLPTGFPQFDRAIGGGLRPGSVELVASRMKVGKSSFANNVALNVAGLKTDDGRPVPVLYVDTEMTIEEQQNRAAAALAGIFVEDIECGRLDRPQQVRLGEALGRLEAMPYYHEEVVGLRFDDILARVRRWVQKSVGYRDDGKAHPCLVIFDYFHIMDQQDVGRQFAEWQTLGFQMAALKSLMKVLGTPCLCFAQQNREGLEHQDERVLRGADRILDKVTSFWLFSRKPEEAVPPAKPGEPRLTHELRYRFSRFGPGLAHDNVINVATDFRRGYMAEGPTRDQLYEMQGGHLKGVGGGRVVESARLPEPAPEPEPTPEE